MDRVDVEAIYDSGRVECVEFILDLIGRFAQHEDRLKRLEERLARTRARVPAAVCGLAEVSRRDPLGPGHGGVVLASWSGRKAATTSCS